MASFYMQWHGPAGLKKIAIKCRFMSQLLMEQLGQFGIHFATNNKDYFDTVAIKVNESGFSSADFVLAQFHKHGINLRKINQNHVGVSFDELTTVYDLDTIVDIFASLKKGKRQGDFTNLSEYEGRKYIPVGDHLKRTDKYMD